MTKTQQTTRDAGIASRAVHLGHPAFRYAPCGCTLCVADTTRRINEEKAGNSKAVML
jgi:hypothetical protein